MTRRVLHLSLLLGLLLPATTTVAAVDAKASAVGPSAVSPDEAKSQLEALARAGVRTHGDLATASGRVLVGILGRSRARSLQSAARAHAGSQGLLDPATPLDVVSIIDPQFIVAPRYKATSSAKRRIEAARRELSNLSELGVRTYGDLIGVDRRELAGVVGRSRARTMIAAAAKLRRLAHASEGSVSIIEPQFLKAPLDAAFVADPTMVVNVQSPLSTVGSAPTPHP